MSNQLNVLSLVSYKFLPPNMGGQKGIAFFNRYFSKHVKLICVTTKNNFAVAEPYTVKNILSDSKIRYVNPFYFFLLKRLIREEGITHLIIEHPYYGWLGILLKWFCKIKLVAHSHNIESLRFKSMGKWWWGLLWHYEKWVHQSADYSFFIHADDKKYALENFKLEENNCTVITYGFEYAAIPTAEEKLLAKETICTTHSISSTDKILLFNGTLGYKPNLDAVNNILEKINPILLAAENFKYKIIICGNKLPVEYNGLIEYKEKNIIYAGFVEDINVYFKGADIFINPVIDGGGIKTKLVEALGYNCSAISTASGAIGIPVEIMGSKMKIITDNDWDSFASSIITMDATTNTSSSFFEHFYWGKIASKASEIINRY